MRKVTVCVGIPASGKSTWAKSEVEKDPNIIRINRDLLRTMMSNYVFSKENEKLIISTRNNIILDSLKANRDTIIDDCNISKRNFDDIVKVVKESGVHCQVSEKVFYIDVDEAIERNSKRTGYDLIPEQAIRSMWKQSGGKLLKSYSERSEIVNDVVFEKAVIDNCLGWAIISDLDGTLSLFNSLVNGKVDIRCPGAHVRNPYNAAVADKDSPNEALVHILNNFAEKGCHLIFCSGRMEEYRPQTVEFLNKHIKHSYDLLMRKDKDIRSDDIVKLELFNNHIRGKYNISAVFDDRLSVCKLWYKLGLPLFRFGDPCANF